jgi:VanZ family protein
MRSVYRRALLWAPPVLYATLIFHFSSESNPLPALTSLVWDKALHTTEYAGLGLLLCRALRGEGVRWWASMVLALLIASAYAASDEWHQWFVPGRDADVLDWVADTIGAAIGSTLYRSIAVLIPW